ncbi:signal peptidase I [Cellulomonas aerilata]|uniref:Signal peptidase I n=1 Tax=Cellulomonas aerilata TaxID=515326 RepID=A0A512D877_9CELL|nr:signal peptidase I [Cellulomonas aerilata]GEO32702.1 signal peptidase I [Cellulomonas aerilata]
MTRRARHLTAAVAVAGAVLLVRGTALEPLTVASPSMEPTLDVGSTVVVDKLTHRWRGVDVGDVVVFTDPEDGDDAVKRVVALAGQTVALRDAVLHVDGVAVDEPQVDLSRIDGTWFGPVTVPEASVFVLGDSRGVSIDSRTYGSVPLDAVEGRVIAAIPRLRGPGSR